ncbi:MAG TPA: ATP-binding protein [Smithellaceae bacterium]|nr:ATP-binding protein [Smithellaceae bacterium]
MKGRLFFKILLSYLAIVALSFVILNSFIRDELTDVLTEKIEREMLAYARLIDLSSPADIKAQIAPVAAISQSRVTLIDAKGNVLADSVLDPSKMDNHLNRPEVQEARVRGEGRSSRFSVSDNTDMFYVAVSVKIRDRIAGYVRLARTLDDVKKTVGDVYRSFLMALMVTFGLALMLALLFSYTLTRPVRILERFTEKLRRGEPSGTLILQTADETRKLADNINYLVGKLQDKIRQADEERSKLMAALTSLSEGILILDVQGRIEFVSRSLSDLLFAQYGDMEGKTLMEALRSAELHQAYRQFKVSGETVSREVTLGRRNPAIMNVSISAVHGYPGEEKAMIIFHDVTRLKKLERIRTDFVANVTHEIRTPLAAMIGCLETLRQGAMSKPQDATRFLDMTLKQAHRLNRLVEDLMTLSKIELGEVEFHFETLSLRDVAESVIGLLAAKAEAGQIFLANEISGDIEPVSGDRDRLTQVLLNVVDNAIKFTPPGGSVTLAAQFKEGGVTVSVADTGTGIPREELQRLGERFYRVDKTRSRDLGGTGLGLSIVKHLMQAHGGEMTIDSQVGKGTTVSLFLPRRRV